MPACMREGTPGGPELGRRAPVALGGASQCASPRRGRGRGRPGPPPPARRAGPSRPARPAGAARGRHWACSDGGQVAPRASFRAARTRDLPGRPAPPDAAGTGRRDPSEPGTGCGVTRAPRRARSRPAPTRPQARGERAGRLANSAAAGSRSHVGAGRGRPVALTWRGRPREREGQARRGGARSGLAAGTRRRRRRWGVGVRSDPGWGGRGWRPRGPSAVGTAAAEGAHSSRDAGQVRRPDLLHFWTNPPLGFQRWHFLGLARANKSSPFRRRYRMIYQVPAVRQLQWGIVCKNAQFPGNSHFRQPKLTEKLRLP